MRYTAAVIIHLYLSMQYSVRNFNLVHTFYLNIKSYIFTVLSTSSKTNIILCNFVVIMFFFLDFILIITLKSADVDSEDD